MNAPPVRPPAAPPPARPSLRPPPAAAPSDRPSVVYVALERVGRARSAWRWVVTMIGTAPEPGWWRVDRDPGDPPVRIGDRAALHPAARRTRGQVATIAAREEGDASLSAVLAVWLSP